MADRRPSNHAPAVVAGEAAAAQARVAGLQADASVDPTAAAFFDIDNTIVRGASHLPSRDGPGAAQLLHDRRRARVRLETGQVPGRRPRGPRRHGLRRRLRTVVRRRTHRRRGQPAHRRRSSTSASPDKLYAGTVALASQHLKAGQRVWLVSAAPIEMASIIADRLGLTGALATVSEIDRRRLHRTAAWARRCTVRRRPRLCERWPIAKDST